jgi:hypothetical protein
MDVIGCAGNVRPMCLQRVSVESRDTGKSGTSGSGRGMWETARKINGKAESSLYAPTPYFHTCLGVNGYPLVVACRTIIVRRICRTSTICICHLHLQLARSPVA